MKKYTREERIALKRKELEDLKAALKRARKASHRAFLAQEIRAVAKQLVELEDRI